MHLFLFNVFNINQYLYSWRYFVSLCCSFNFSCCLAIQLPASVYLLLLFDNISPRARFWFVVSNFFFYTIAQALAQNTHTQTKKKAGGLSKRSLFVACFISVLIPRFVFYFIFFFNFYMGLWGALFDIPIPFVNAAPFTLLERVLCILAAAATTKKAS